MASEATSRRDLLKNAALAGTGLMLGSFIGACGGSSHHANGQQQPPPGANVDADILNFALNLEYLEAEYYLLGMNGTGLSSADKGGGSSVVTGGRKVTFATPLLADYFAAVAADEQAHVRFIRSALGAAAVPEPNINFTDAFDALAAAAGIGASFDPFADENSFLLGAFVFEDVGVTAYKGAAPLLTDKNILTAAAGILGVEAYHAGNIRTAIIARGSTKGEGVTSLITSSTKISDLRATLDGTGTGPGRDDKPVTIDGTPSGRAQVVSADANAIAFSRTTDQVLKIVYASPDKRPGGFFPNGLNGTIK